MNNMEKDLKKNNPSKISFGIGKAIFYAILAIFAMQIISGIIQLPTVFYKFLNHIFLPLGFLLGIMGGIGLLLGMLKTNSSEIIEDIKSKFSVTELVLAIFIWIGFLPYTEFFTTLIPTDGIFKDIYHVFEDSFKIVMDYKISAFLMICIFAPIFEEILFRGIILKGMLNYKVNPIIAIIISALIFGIAHMNPWQFIGAGILGGVFGYVYYRTKSLLILIILHALNNILSFFLLLQTNDMDEQVFDTTDYISMSIFAGLALIIGFIFHRITKSKEITLWN